MTTKTLKLTDIQQANCIKLFEGGTKKYTDIAKKLKLNYVAVNKFMTKWKKKHGILKARKNAQKSKDKVPAIGTSTDVVTKSELLFLRKFYLSHIKNEARS